MKALCRAEAKSNRALFADTCRDVGMCGLHLAPQGLLAPGALIPHAQDVDLPVPYPAGHIGIVGIGRQQPAGDAIGQCQQVLRAVDRPAHRFLILIGKLQDLRWDIREVLLTEDGNPGQQLPAGEPLLDA